jgi:hypothetical protein
MICSCMGTGYVPRPCLRLVTPRGTCRHCLCDSTSDLQATLRRHLAAQQSGLRAIQRGATQFIMGTEVGVDAQAAPQTWPATEGNVTNLVAICEGGD